MGGQIRVIIREEDGTIHRQTRWTNALPCFVKSVEFFNNDKEYVNRYVESYDKTGNTQFISPNTEYGMVILDFKDKWVGSMNSYGGFDCYTITALMLRANGVVDGKGRLDLTKCNLEYNDFIAGYKLYNSGFLKFFKESYYTDKTVRKTEVLIKEFSLSEMNKLYKYKTRKSLFKSNSSLEYEEISGILNYEKLGWSLNEYNEDINGNVSFFKDILSHDFTITPGDINNWQEHINKISEDEDETNNVDSSNILKSTLRELTLDKIV